MNHARANTEITISLDALTAVAVAGNLALALAHPLNTGASVPLAKAVLSRLLTAIEQTGLLSPEEMEAAYNFAKVEVKQEDAQRRLLRALCARN